MECIITNSFELNIDNSFQNKSHCHFQLKLFLVKIIAIIVEQTKRYYRSVMIQMATHRIRCVVFIVWLEKIFGH